MLAGSLVQDIDGKHGIVLIMEGKGGKCLSHVHHGCVDAADVNATLSANASGDQGDALNKTHLPPLKRSDTGRSTSLGREPEKRLVSEGREVPGAAGLLRG